jgi:hypothetical protein
MPKTDVPVLVRGRKGQRSIADSLARALAYTSGRKSAWPALTFAELVVFVSTDQGYDVRDSTVRSTVYGHPELFESSKVDGKTLWRLTEAARKLVR